MIKKILVPLDGSALAEKALAHAEDLAKQFEAEVILVWVLHPLIVMSDYGSSSYQQIVALEQQEAKEYLVEKEIDLIKDEVAVHSKIMEGQAAQAILDLACREKVDLIVMSTHGRSGLSRWIQGSVASKILHHAPCPVYLVRVRESEC